MHGAWEMYYLSSDHYFVTNGSSALSCDEASTSQTKQLRMLGKAGLLIQAGMGETEAVKQAKEQVEEDASGEEEARPEQPGDEQGDTWQLPAQRSFGEYLARALELSAQSAFTSPAKASENIEDVFSWTKDTETAAKITPQNGRSQKSERSEEDAAKIKVMSPLVRSALPKSPVVPAPRTTLRTSYQKAKILGFNGMTSPQTKSLNDFSTPSGTGKTSSTEQTSKYTQLASSPVRQGLGELQQTPQAATNVSMAEIRVVDSGRAIEHEERPKIGLRGLGADSVTDVDAEARVTKRKRDVGDTPEKDMASVRRRIRRGEDD